MNQSLFHSFTGQLPFYIRQLYHKKQIIALFGFIFAVIFILFLLLAPTDVTAQKLKESKKEIVSIQINKGDTLWSIASRYMTDDYKDMNTYIDEIKETNGLSSDTIHEGSYIVVPYFAQGE